MRENTREKVKTSRVMRQKLFKKRFSLVLCDKTQEINHKLSVI
jgi:hypothetical protein